MPVLAAEIIGVVLAIAGTVLAFIFILPEKRRASLNKFFQTVADIFNFKVLFIEIILKALYIFLTLFCVVCGFFMLFSGQKTSSFWGEGSFQSFALQGLLLMIVGPIVVRITYELLMLIILMVQNVISINKKMPKPTQEEVPQTPVAPSAPATKMVYCTHCGTRYDALQGGCPNGCQDQ